MSQQPACGAQSFKSLSSLYKTRSQRCCASLTSPFPAVCECFLHVRLCAYKCLFMCSRMLCCTDFICTACQKCLDHALPLVNIFLHSISHVYTQLRRFSAAQEPHMCTLNCVDFLLHKNLTCVHSIALLFCLQELQYLQGRAGNNDNLPLFFSPLTQPLTHFTSTDTALTIAPDCIFSAPCKDSSTSRAWMAYPSRPFFSHTPSPCLAFGSAASFRQ